MFSNSNSVWNKKGVVFLLFFLVFLLIVAFSSCDIDLEDDGVMEREDRIRIISTIFPAYDFAKEIAGNNAYVSMLLPPGAESHSFEPSPLDIIAIEESDLFIYVGGESDEWVTDVLMSIGKDQDEIIKLIDSVNAVEEVIVPGMEEEKEESTSTVGKEYDEHIWTSPENAKLIVKKICSKLEEIDDRNYGIYDKNAEIYEMKLDELDRKFQEVVKNGKRKTIIFGDRFPFRYLADAYGLDYFAAFPGCSTETECSAKTLKYLIDKVRKEKVPVVFHIELSNKEIAKSIAEETGVKVKQLHAAHNVSKDEFNSGKTYLEIMEDNVESLREALA
ncbi:MAG: metal ABC transporter substrate-binding protein [Clostridiales Family XIII bacterium]|nr:metal ABC transporter substrate-binding protein [Clostridiales Family XIII bacterium]